MFKRCMTICLAAVLVVGMFLGAMLNAGAAENVSIYDLLDELPMKHVSYTYEDRSSKPSTEESGSVWFSPALLLQDSRAFSGEMAKASVALAMAAYRRNHVKDLLQGMGFDVEEDSALYDYIYDRNENDLRIDYCDFVAFSITHLEVTHPTTGISYRIYAVPIKGTTENAEWFSNFNIGTGDEHEGFKKASEEVYEYLNERIDNDQFPDENTIVWLTGHSRGAACANLIAGWLSSPGSRIRQEHVFAYTFACPSVALDADTTLMNIYNFNNPGDLIPLLPLERWDYKRYGKTIMLDTSEDQLSNVRQQFSAARGASYAAEISEDNLLALVEGMFDMRLDEFRDSATAQAILTVVAWLMGGKTDATFKEAISRHFVDVPEILWEITDGFGIKEKVAELLGISDECADLLEWLYDAYEDAAKMSDTEFAVFREENADMIKQVEEASGAEILVPASLLSAQTILQQMAGDITSLAGCIQAAINLVLDDNGNIMDKVGHGHTQITYTVWINSLYYGHQGWMASEKTSFSAAEAGVLSIGDGCFFRCEAMETVNLDAPHVYVGHNAFGQCYNLKMVTLPVDFVQSGSPFAGTSNVETIFYTYGHTGVMWDRGGGDPAPLTGDTLEYESRYSIQTIDFAEGITHIGDHFLLHGASVTTLKLPTTLKTIGDRAFRSCSHLTEIDLPDTLVRLGEGAFSECAALTKITLHPGLKHIGEEAFSGCTSLQSIQINADVETIGSSAFANCDSLTALPKLPAAITAIPDGLFYDCDGLTAVTIPETVSAIGSEAFKDCDSLTTLTVPDTVTALGLYAFGKCEALRTVTLPVDYDISGAPFSSTSGVTTIHFTPGQTGIVPDRSSDRYAENYYGHTLEYSSRDSLRSVDYASGVIRIGAYAYGFGSTALASLKLPATMQSIGDYALYNCDALTEIFIPASVTEIGAYAFYDCDGMEALTLPDTTASLGTYAFADCDGLRTVTLPVDYDISNNPFAGNCSYATGGVTTIYFTPGQTGIMPDRTNTGSNANSYYRTLEYAGRNSIQTVDFAEGIVHIGDYFFSNGCTTLKEVKLPSTLTSIGIRAFSGCTALSGIDLPMGIETLGDYAFHNCASLTELTIPKTVTAIGERAFYDCDGMVTLTLPDTPVALGTYAFGSCDGLRTVTLPVDYDISNDPFAGNCSYATGGVTTIYFTPGQTGIMPDRTNTGSNANSYYRTLEHASHNSIQTIHFAEGIARIGDYFFGGGSTTLKEVKLPSTLTAIGSHGFYGCTALPGIDLPEGLTAIGSHVFYNCVSFTELPRLPKSLAAISDYAFYGCSGLTELTIPQTVTAIGERAFYDCDGMETLTLPDTPVALGTYAFGSCDGLRTVTLPVDYDISNDPFAGNCSYATGGVTTIYFTPGQTGIMPDRTNTGSNANSYYITLEYASRNSIQTIHFAEGIARIGSYALRDLSASPEITFRGNAPEIASNAFDNTTATCYYPASDKTWTADILQHYGGTLSWVAYDDRPVTLSAKSFTLSFEDEILVNFYYTVSNLTDVAEHGMLVFYSEPGTVDVANADAVYQAAAYDAVNDRHMATTSGIAAKEMGDTRYYAAYAKCTDGTYVYSGIYDYSPKKYATNMLNKATASQKQKALCVAMLNYGAAAQEYFGYNTDNLMNSALTAEQQALNIAYDSSLFTGAVAADTNKTGNFPATATGFSKKNATVSFEGAFCVNYYFTPNCAVSGDMTLYIWTPEAYAAADILTAENASAITMAALSDGRCWGQVSGIAAKSLDETYYVAAVYADGAGNTYCTGVIAYSLSRYCMNNASGNMGELAQATAMYGYYAKQFFTT